MKTRSYILLTVIYTSLHLAHICLSCVLLLNGWTPLSVRERAELAEISVLGQVLKTHREQGTEDDTYTAEFRLLNVYKGHDLLANVTKSVALGNVYNISNFGSKAQCYADVETGSRYILFLTLYEGQLSAQYDDLFGAAARFSEPDEEDILAYLGWDQWTPWSACTTGCGGGRRMRSRDCPRDNSSSCVGESREIRTCNLFSCEDSHDLLTKMGVRVFPLGVSQSTNRTSAYVIGKEAKLSLPASRIYDVSLPSTFTLLMKIKIDSRKKKGYFFVISDVQGKQQLAIYFGRKLKFQYLGNNYGFKFNVLDNVWHTIGISVDDSFVTLHGDCDFTLKRRLRSKDEYLGTNLMMSIGPYFSQYGNPFEGEVEQLVISSNPEAARQQCGLIVLDNSADIPDLETSTTRLMRYTTTPTRPLVYGSDWSAWSACSTTCGQGRQTRALYCRANIVSTQSCVPVSPLRTQTRLCYLGSCQECYPLCQNGGLCLPGNVCKCDQGFSGSHCQNKECVPDCQNGGVCNMDGLCMCPKTHTGRFCETPACNPPCQNGGQCVVPGQCACPYGYSGSSCENRCSFQCHNKGECIGPDKCKCTELYTGKDCSIPICKRGCYNGGQCQAPDQCVCKPGYYGRRCHRARCRPKCQNGGVCVSPGQCLCKSGYTGSRCQRVQCRFQCLNGGKCTSPNRCQCQPGFYGRRCQKERCKITCLNGGRCVKNKCKCPKGFRGRKCERRACTYEHYLVPHRRTYRKVIREEYPTPCGFWSFKTCRRTRLKYVLITKDTYRTAYRCV